MRRFIRSFNNPFIGIGHSSLYFSFQILERKWLVEERREEPISVVVQKSSGTKMHGMATHEARRAHEHEAREQNSSRKGKVRKRT